jgi:hypothetical protein
MVIELVTWKKFAEGVDGWASSNMVSAEVEVVKTAGIRVKENDETLVLAQSFNQTDDQYAQCLVIPKAVIINRQFKQDTEM